jgi:hypothetical protein
VAMVSLLRFAVSFASRISVRIFILEGLLTIAMSVVAIFLVPTWPQKAKWVWETTSRGHCPIAHTIAVDRCRALPPSDPLG